MGPLLEIEQQLLFALFFQCFLLYISSFTFLVAGQTWDKPKESGLRDLPPLNRLPRLPSRVLSEDQTSPEEVVSEQTMVARKQFWDKFKKPKIVESTAAAVEQPPLAFVDNQLGDPSIRQPDQVSPAAPTPSPVTPPVTPAEAPSPPEAAAKASASEPAEIDNSDEEFNRKENALLSHFYKMDTPELKRKVDHAKAHALFDAFEKEMSTPDELGNIAVNFGKETPEEDLCAFELWLQKQPVVAKDTQAAPPVAAVPEPPKGAPEKVEKPATSTASPADVSEALKRMTTVDLENGAKPFTLSATAAKPTETVVLMTVGGTQQAVTVALSPEQCKAAGLQLLSETTAAAPTTAATPATPATTAAPKAPVAPTPTEAKPTEPQAVNTGGAGGPETPQQNEAALADVLGQACTSFKLGGLNI